MKGMTIKDAYKLFHEGSNLFIDMSREGLRIDVPYLEDQYYNVLPQLIQECEDNLKEHDEVKQWIKKRGKKWSPDSDPQLQDVVYNQMGLKPIAGEKKTDKETLKRLGVPFADDLQSIRKYLRARNTFVKNLLQEHIDGYVHADINLLIPRSYRSACNSPNLQNLPERDKIVSELVKKGVIPRDGNQFTEYDFKGMEVSFSCVYHKDPNMIEYLNNPDLDMHWDSVCDCFMLDLQMSDFKEFSAMKALRYVGKNKFTFPEFYGMWWKDLAPPLWEEIDEHTLPNGLTLRRHLARNGITELGEVEYDRYKRPHTQPGTFYDHIRKVEEYFWNEKFPKYKQWKDNWFKQYKQTGGFKMYTGFEEHNILTKNDVTNHPVQGTAFHALLKCSILTMDEIYDRDMDAQLVIQVHDSMLGDHSPDTASELDDTVLDIVNNDIPEIWNWINVPLVIEAERSKVDGSWCDMEEIEL